MARSDGSWWCVGPIHFVFILTNDIPVEDGTFPFYRTEDVEEERYVNRSQFAYIDIQMALILGACYMLRAHERKVYYIFVTLRIGLLVVCSSATSW